MEEAKFAAARRAAGVSADRAAKACGVSRPTLSAREHYPLDYRLSELVGLYNELDETGKKLLLEAIRSAFN